MCSFVYCFKQRTAYEMRISDWSSDVSSSDLKLHRALGVADDGIIGLGTYTTLFARFGAGPERAAELALSANVHFPAYSIMDSGLRLAHFMAQQIGRASCRARG